MRVIGKPIEFFARIPPSAGLHFLSIPFSKLFADYYAVSELTSKEYPGLVSEGHPVETSEFRRYWRFTTGPRAVIATVGLKGSRRRFSINGENFASLRGTPNGAT